MVVSDTREELEGKLLLILHGGDKYTFKKVWVFLRIAIEENGRDEPELNTGSNITPSLSLRAITVLIFAIL